jgi:hypothetical protein
MIEKNAELKKHKKWKRNAYTEHKIGKHRNFLGIGVWINGEK